MSATDADAVVGSPGVITAFSSTGDVVTMGVLFAVLVKSEKMELTLNGLPLDATCTSEYGDANMLASMALGVTTDRRTAASSSFSNAGASNMLAPAPPAASADFPLK